MNRRTFFSGLAAFLGLGAVAKPEPAQVKELAREFVGQIKPGTVLMIPAGWTVNNMAGTAIYSAVTWTCTDGR